MNVSSREVHYLGRQLLMPDFAESGDLLANMLKFPSFIDQEIKPAVYELKSGVNRTGYLVEDDLKVLKNRIYYDKPDNPTAEELQLVKLLEDKGALLELVKYWGAIIADPVLFFGYLRDLEQDVKRVMEAERLALPAKLFRYVMAGKGTFVPGPREAALKPVANAEKLLSDVLLRREQGRGINRDGVPRYIGAITREISDDLVASGHVFEDDPLISKLLIHGTYSHRFDIDALAESLKDHPVLSHFPPRQILNLLLSVKRQDNDQEISLWDYLIDNVTDMCLNDDSSQKAYLEPRNYATSCRSPIVLNAILLCFGKEIGLPYLQYLLLEIFWNAAEELKRNVLRRSAGTADDETLYLALFAAHQCSKNGFSDIVNPMAGSLTSEERGADPKFHNFPGNPHGNIKSLDPEAKQPAYHLTRRMELAQAQDLWLKGNNQSELLIKAVRLVKTSYRDLQFTELMMKLKPTPHDFAMLILVALYANKTGFLKYFLKACGKFTDAELQQISVTHQAIDQEKWNGLKILLKSNIELLKVIDPFSGETVEQRLRKMNYNIDFA